MFLSRFWTLLLVIACALMFAVSMLAKDLVNRERQEHAEQAIYGEYDKAEVAFTLYARKRLDVLLAVSADAEVRQLVTEAGASEKKRDEVRSKLLTALNRLNDGLKQYKADIMMALDTKGTVIVQTGTRGRANDFSLAGLPTVDAALRGYVRDDVWKLGSDVYLIAARPVIENNRYVGAVLHAVIVNDLLASRFSTSAQVGFYAGQVMIAIGKPDEEGLVLAPDSEVSGPLTTIGSQKNYVEKGRSDVVRINGKEQDFLALYARVRGEAALNDVGWVVLVPIAKPIALTSIYEEAGTQDVHNLPFVLIVGAALMVLLLGWFWNYLEAERPLSRLYQAVKALETADVKDQLNVYKFKRSIRRIAKSFNTVMDYKIREAVGGAGGAKNVNAILGSQENVRLSSASFRFSADVADDIPAPPSMEAPPPDARPRTGANRIGPTPPQGAPRMPTQPQKPMGVPAVAPGAPPPPPPPAAAGGMTDAEEKAYFQQIHQEFVALKQKLGESTDGLTFDRFEVTLKKNRDALKARYGCPSVKFNVYEKDGKASLKAVPFK